jgi:hypothetical protein
MLPSKRLITSILVLTLASLACASPFAPKPPTPTALPTSTPYPTQFLPSPTPLIAEGPTATTLPGPYGPTGYPPNVDPLTGLTVADPAVLNRRPLLIKVSNESPVVRPQSGMSFADHVWEYQMEGYALTRYTAVFLSQTPERVGSVRSARLIDIDALVDMYGGVLVYSGGSTNRHAPGTPPRVNELMNAAPFVQRVVTQDYLPNIGAAYDQPYFQRLDFPSAAIPEYHRLFAIPAEIWKLATEKNFNDRPNLDGLMFNFAPPAGGTATTAVAIDYPGKGPKKTWTYNQPANKWTSETEDQQAATPSTPDVDLITNQPLAFDNVVVVYAFHSDSDFLEDEKANLASVRIQLNGEGQCVLLRDGQRFDCIWKRADKGGQLQFFDVNNNPLAFKPGNTWFNVVSSNIAKPTVTFAP